MEHNYSLKVRGYECDINGHVNNAEYLRYLEAARMEFLHDIDFPYSRMHELGYAIFVSKIVIEYKAPALPDQTLHITTKPVKRQITNGTFDQTITNGEKTVARAEVTWVVVNPNGKPCRLPPEFDKEELYP